MRNRTKQLGDEIRGVQISTAELKQLIKKQTKSLFYFFISNTSSKTVSELLVLCK